MKVVQELVAYFDRRGKLSRRQLRRLLEHSFVASDAPVASWRRPRTRTLQPDSATWSV